MLRNGGPLQCSHASELPVLASPLSFLLLSDRRCRRFKSLLFSLDRGDQAIEGKLLSLRFQRDTLPLEAVVVSIFQMPQPVINRNPHRTMVIVIDDPGLALH